MRPSTGTVAPQNVPPLDGVVEPVFWEGLDVNSVGSAAEGLPEPPQNEATFQWQQDNQEEPA